MFTSLCNFKIRFCAISCTPKPGGKCSRFFLLMNKEGSSLRTLIVFQKERFSDVEKLPTIFLKVPPWTPKDRPHHNINTIYTMPIKILSMPKF